MKKWLSCVLVLTMLLSLLSGCGAAPAQESSDADAGIFYELTGIPAGKTVMTVSGVNISAEEYLYWLAYLCTSMEYNITNYNAYYGSYANLINPEDSSVIWDGEFQDGMTLAEYARNEAESTIKFYTAIELMAQKYNAGLDEEDKAAIVESLNGAIAELGGQEAFDAYLKKLGISQDTFQNLSASGYLFDNLLLLVLQEGTDLYLQPENYSKYATYADHILLTTIDTDSGKALSPEQLQEKKALAEDLLAQLRSSEDPVALFSQLADQYSEDPGREENPDGYVFTPNTMVKVFEDTANALEVGQISDIVESDYGYHIILRKDLQDALDADPEQKVSLAQTHLTTLLTILAGEATVEVMPEIQNLDVAAFYPAYSAKVKELTIANAEAMAADAKAAQSTAG